MKQKSTHKKYNVTAQATISHCHNPSAVFIEIMTVLNFFPFFGPVLPQH